MNKLVSKSLVHKKIYQNIKSKNDLPKMDVEQLAQLLIENPKGIPNYVKHELHQHPVNFRSVMEGTRKDIIFHYKQLSRIPIYEEPTEFEGITYRVISNYEESEKITRVDHVSFFTKIKDNTCEHRIYQIGRRYFDHEIYRLEDLIRGYKREGDDRKNIETYNQLIKLDPKNKRNYISLVELYNESNQFEKSIELCKETLLIDGRSYEIWNCLGEAYYGKGEKEKALKFFEFSVGLYSKFFKGLFNLGKISLEMKNYENALSYCSYHLEADITKDKIYSKQVKILLEEVLKELNEKINSDSKDIDSRLILGEFYYDQSDFDKALILFNDILAIEPNNADTLVFTGLISVENRDYENAIKIYKKVLEMEPEDEVVWDNLGLAYEFNKESTESIQAYEKASQLAPKDLEISQHLAMAHLNAQNKNLEVNDIGCLLNEEQKTFYRGHVVEYFNKDFIDPMIRVNMKYEDFQAFIETRLPLLISNLEVYYGFEAIKSLIFKMINDTKASISLILPVVHPEILSYCSKYAFKNKEAKIVLISYWDMEMYGNIISKMIMLGNIQIRQLISPPSFFGIFKDEKELILMPINENLNEMLGIKSIDPEFVKFLNQIIVPIFNANSRPIS